MFLVDDGQCAIVYDHAFRSWICMAFFIFNVPLYLHQYVFIYLLCFFIFASLCISASISELALYLPCHVFVDLSLRYLGICVAICFSVYLRGTFVFASHFSIYLLVTFVFASPFSIYL